MSTTRMHRADCAIGSDDENCHIDLSGQELQQSITLKVFNGKDDDCHISCASRSFGFGKLRIRVVLIQRPDQYCRSKGTIGQSRKI